MSDTFVLLLVVGLAFYVTVQVGAFLAEKVALRNEQKRVDLKKEELALLERIEIARKKIERETAEQIHPETFVTGCYIGIRRDDQ